MQPSTESEMLIVAGVRFPEQTQNLRLEIGPGALKTDRIADCVDGLFPLRVLGSSRPWDHV